MKSIRDTKNLGGRPKSGQGTPIMVRLQPDALSRVDDFRARRREPITRPNAIRSMLSSLDEVISLTEAAIEAERKRGTHPDDGSAAGELMAAQEAWIAKQRGQLDNAMAESHSWYDPKTPPRGRY
jgi:hypothetical protein